MILKNKVAIVTGGSGDIGRAISLAFAREGAKVVVNHYDGDGQAARDVVEQIAAQGGEAFPIKADVAKSSQVDRMVQKTLGAFGRIDILMNNAGISQSKPIMEITEKDWDWVIGVNLKGVFNCSKAVMDIMIDQGSGRIINMSSVSAKRGHLFGAVHYSASKAGIIGFTKALALTGVHHGITVNAIAPGNIDAGGIKLLPPEKLTKVIKKIPAGRLGKPEEVAEAVVFLASEAADYITGATIDINGGAYMS